jgi:hypothetical protein
MQTNKGLKEFMRLLDERSVEGGLSDDGECLAMLASIKWAGGFKCRKCGNDRYCSGKKPYSRRCTRCKSEESATAHTVFHGCKMPLVSAFRIMHEICRRPGVSTYELSRMLGTRQMTCWKLKKKITACLESGRGI